MSGCGQLADRHRPAALRHKVRPGVVRGIFESMVELADHGDLMPRFLALPFPRIDPPSG